MSAKWPGKAVEDGQCAWAPALGESSCFQPAQLGLEWPLEPHQVQGLFLCLSSKISVCIYLKKYLFERHSDRKLRLLGVCIYSQNASNSQDWFCHSLIPRIPPRSCTWLAGTQVHGPSLLLFQCINRKLVRSLTSTLMGKQQHNLFRRDTYCSSTSAVALMCVSSNPMSAPVVPLPIQPLAYGLGKQEDDPKHWDLLGCISKELNLKFRSEGYGVWTHSAMTWLLHHVVHSLSFLYLWLY